METHDFSNAKVGDKVTCLTFGIGVIFEILQKDLSYKLRVKFKDNSIQCYNFDGKWRWDFPSTLYHGHVDFKIEAIPICPYKTEEMIAVSNNDSLWIIASFDKMAINGVFVTLDGRTSLFQYHKKLSEFNT